jgi:hypothetical protein
MTFAALLALALLAQDAAAAEPQAPAVQVQGVDVVGVRPADFPVPPGAPADDFGLTAWCYGSLARWMELSPRAMPEVRRIEGLFTRPGSSLEEDMAAYTELQTASERNLALFTGALRTAEAASARPLVSSRDAAIAKGQSVWTGADALTDRRLAQEWMSWTLPGRCETAAARLRERAELAAPALRGADPAPPEAATAEPLSAGAAPADPAPADTTSAETPPAL